MPDMNQVVGSHDILLVTLDTLRYDVAARLWAQGRTPTLAALLPPSGWEARHAPASFTYAAHHAFFAGFLPTPRAPGRHPRLFAADFPGSQTSGPHTCRFAEADIVSGLAARGYHTLCIGGVGFFNGLTPLGRVLPSLFKERHWDPTLGVTEPHSTENQVRVACDSLARLPAAQRLFLFLNISALHQPNYFYLPGATEDTLDSHAAALAYVDGALAPLFAALRARGPTFCILCSDHGTAYGEGGYQGHRLGHPVVWTVPYTHFFLTPEEP